MLNPSYNIKETTQQIIQPFAPIIGNPNGDVLMAQQPILRSLNQEQLIGKTVDNMKEYLLQYPTYKMKVKVNADNFLFYDDNNMFVGQFSVNDIVVYATQKYISKQMDPATKKLIETSICSIKDNDGIQLNTLSPFMRELDLLFILNDSLRIFEMNKIHEFTSQNNEIVLHIIRKLIYSILEHTINVIAMISKDLTDDVIKNKLMRRSMGYMYRLTQYINASLKICENKFTSMMETVETLKHVEERIEKEIFQMREKK